MVVNPPPLNNIATISHFLYLGFRNTSNRPQNRFFRSFDVNVLDGYLKAFKKERGASISNIKRVRGILINFLQFHGAAQDLKSDVTPSWTNFQTLCIGSRNYKAIPRHA